MYTLALNNDRPSPSQQQPNPSQLKESQYPPQLSPASLFETQAKIDSMRLDVFNTILKTVHQRIRTTAKTTQSLGFSVPEWQPGCASFDVKQCILYIVTNLRDSGFDVIYIGDNRLFISWQRHSEQYYLEQSPIKQALNASATASITKTSQQPRTKKPSNYKPMADSLAGMISIAADKGGKSITFI